MELNIKLIVIHPDKKKKKASLVEWRYRVTSGIYGDPVDEVFLTKVDCPVGIRVIYGGVDTVAFGVGCAGITVDDCTAVVVITGSMVD